MRVHKRADRSGPKPGPGQSWPLESVEVLDDLPVWKPSGDYVSKAVVEGWASLSRGKFVVHSEPEVVYRVVRGPGRYCCFDDRGPFDSEADARAYIAERYPGEESPDPQNPVGYRVDNFYYLEKE